MFETEKMGLEFCKDIKITDENEQIQADWFSCSVMNVTVSDLSSGASRVDFDDSNHVRSFCSQKQESYTNLILYI